MMSGNFSSSWSSFSYGDEQGENEDCDDSGSFSSSWSSSSYSVSYSDCSGSESSDGSSSFSDDQREELRL